MFGLLDGCQEGLAWVGAFEVEQALELARATSRSPFLELGNICVQDWSIAAEGLFFLSGLISPLPFKRLVMTPHGQPRILLFQLTLMNRHFFAVEIHFDLVGLWRITRLLTNRSGTE